MLIQGKVGMKQNNIIMEIKLVEETEETIRKRNNERLVLESMELHEMIDIGSNFNSYKVMRVHGGWLYTHYGLGHGVMTTTFVPFSQDGQYYLQRVVYGIVLFGNV